MTFKYRVVFRDFEWEGMAWNSRHAVRLAMAEYQSLSNANEIAKVYGPTTISESGPCEDWRVETQCEFLIHHPRSAEAIVTAWREKV